MTEINPAALDAARTEFINSFPAQLPFPPEGRQIYVAYDWLWDRFAAFADQNGWALCLIPSDGSAPDHDGIPTYYLQAKEPES